MQIGTASCCLPGIRVYSPRNLFRQLFVVRKSLREACSQFLIYFEEWPAGDLSQIPLAIRSLAWIRRAHPVLNGGRDDSYGLGSLGFLTDDKQCLGALAFARRAQPFHL